jgi:cytochrome c peroxidase
MIQIILTSVLLMTLAGCGSDSNSGPNLGSATGDLPELASKQLLGDALFHDKNLSKDGSQSCATCHNPDSGFSDSRDSHGLEGNAPYAASLGDDGTSLGARNAPTAAYAALIPEFWNGTRTRNGQQQVKHGAYQGYMGGQFWDGRESSLAGQAGGPPTNPLEMAMDDESAVVTVLKENADYVEAFEYFYGEQIFNSDEDAYSAMTNAIAEFEATDEAQFLSFDSKYDKSLVFPSEYQYLSESKADKGRVLFFSSDLACAACHQFLALPSRKEPFTSFEYHNIGVPLNTELKGRRESLDLDHPVDFGLAKNGNIAAEDIESSKGKFKVPSMRNVTLTAPYMHNGVFNSLEGVLAFYEHARIRGRGGISTIVNPETELVFRDPELDMNISAEILSANQLNLLGIERRGEAIECFLMTLTDAKYEHLLDQAKVTDCGI